MTTASDSVQPARSTVTTAALTSVGFVALLWISEIVDTVLAHRLDQFGIRPRTGEGLLGILWAPLLHAGFPHLIANTGPVLVLLFVVMLSGPAAAVRATTVIWLVGGAGTWLIGASGSVHIGASGLVFGWVTYLVLRGIFTRRVMQVVVGIGVLLLYGGVLWGVFPGQPGVSWQMHLFGAIGGVLAAVAAGRTRRHVA
ncbi:rhomboid family intramembrane serine protease [Microbacterium gorillae]|uniref:rhomboid family intramembrane serine protease n=1 Tax=Microbacterium gorillae TaxID=1231063 RepID=UPI0006944BCD|nr:rhomboid family intramembrane serine protease [Microbacterium gorillae]